jgi:hypothetical protein
MLGQHLTLDFAELGAERPAHPRLAPLGADLPEIPEDLGERIAGRPGPGVP